MKTKLLTLLMSLFIATQVQAETLTVQIGVTRKFGETKPVTNSTVRLLRSRIEPGKLAPNSDWQKILATFNASIEENTLYVSTTDFLGKVIFDDIPDGTYYIFCDATCGTYEKQAVVRGKSTFVSLNNEDLL